MPLSESLNELNINIAVMTIKHIDIFSPLGVKFDRRDGGEVEIDQSSKH